MSKLFKFDPNSTTNEGRWRLIDPKVFAPNSMRSWYSWQGIQAPGIRFIVGIDNRDKKWKPQAIRFDKKLWTEEKAAAWWQKHKDRFVKEWQPSDWQTNIKTAKTSKFVIQEHDATRAGKHFDLRFERGNVAKSFAVPKHTMPSTGEKVLAIQVQDHPVSFMKWEGTVPEGTYGAGNIRIFDQGEYRINRWTDDVIDVTFEGNKIKGRYVFIHTGDAKWLITKPKKQIVTAAFTDVRTKLFDFYGVAFLPITERSEGVSIKDWLSDSLTYDAVTLKVSSVIKLAKTYLDEVPTFIYDELLHCTDALGWRPVLYLQKVGYDPENPKHRENVNEFMEKADYMINRLVNSFSPETRDLLKELREYVLRLEGSASAFYSRIRSIPLPEAIRIFREFVWRPYYGGELWAQIAEATIRLGDYYKKVVPTDDPVESIGPIVERYVRDPKDLNNLAVALDLYDSLEHNTGSLFRYSAPEMPYWLTLVASGTYQPEILSKMSSKVRQIVSAYYREVGPPESRKQFVDNFIGIAAEKATVLGKVTDASLAGDLYKYLKDNIKGADTMKAIVFSKGWRDYELQYFKQLEPNSEGIEEFSQELHFLKKLVPNDFTSLFSNLLGVAEVPVIEALFEEESTDTNLFVETCYKLPLDCLFNHLDKVTGSKFYRGVFVLFQRAISEDYLNYIPSYLNTETAPVLSTVINFVPELGPGKLKLMDIVLKKFQQQDLTAEAANDLLQSLGYEETVEQMLSSEQPDTNSVQEAPLATDSVQTEEPIENETKVSEETELQMEEY